MKNLISNRETQVLNLISYGNSSCEIAAKLFISEHTAVTHRRNLMGKLNVKNSAGLVRKGFELGLIVLRAKAS